MLIVAPLWFNVNFALLLGKRFDYPDILRRPTAEILERFRAGGSSLILLWWTFMLSGLLLNVRSGAARAGPSDSGASSRWRRPSSRLAGLVQMLGLLRWVYVVPALARAYADPNLGSRADARPTPLSSAPCTSTSGSVSANTSATFSRASGPLLIGVGIIQGTALPTWLGWPGVVIGVGLVIGSAEFLGPNEERGWALARRGDPDPLHRMVSLAARDGYRPNL